MYTPQEVSEKTFPKSTGLTSGYNMTAVDEFLDGLTEDYTALYKDNTTLKAKLKMLAEKVAKSGAKVYLVNTGWNGTGKRMKLSYTRAMVTAALNGELEKAEFVTDPYFGVAVPTSCPNVPEELMIPANTWKDKAAYEAKAKELARSFVENFKKYNKMPADVVDAGPKV